MLRVAVGAAEAAQPQAVGDHEDARQRHRRAGDDRVEESHENKVFINL